MSQIFIFLSIVTAIVILVIVGLVFISLSKLSISKRKQPFVEIDTGTSQSIAFGSYQKLNKETVKSYITESEKVLDWFGYWPTFHDGEILWVYFNRGIPVIAGNVVLEMGIFAFEITTKWGELLVHRHCLIHLRFFNCSDIKLEGFNQQNQCSTIEFGVEKQVSEGLRVIPNDFVVFMENGELKVPDEVLIVKINTEFGVEGSFKCYRAEVVSIQPCDKEGNVL